MHRNLPNYLSGDPEGTMVFDVPTFLREAGLADTPERRRDVGVIALRVVRDTYPGAQAVLVSWGGGGGLSNHDNRGSIRKERNVRIFSGYYDHRAGRPVVLFDGQPMALPPLRPDEARHSPTGFNWGYHGSGPAELARAILVAVLPDEPAARHPGCYQRFKAEIVGEMSREWLMSDGAVLAWFGQWRTTRAGREILETLAHEAAPTEGERGGNE